MPGELQMFRCQCGKRLLAGVELASVPVSGFFSFSCTEGQNYHTHTGDQLALIRVASWSVTAKSSD